MAQATVAQRTVAINLSDLSGIRSFVRMVLPLSLLVLWYLLSLGWPRSPQFATPLGVVRAFFELWAKGHLQAGALISIERILAAFTLAAILGGSLGLLMGYWPALDGWLGPLVHTLRPIAPYAWIPLVILWLGIGDAAVISIVAYAAFFPMTVNAITGARNIDRNLIDTARVLGASPLTLFSRVFFPAALPSLLVGARLAMGSAWIAVVAAELASGSRATQSAMGGLGQMMYIFYAYSINLNYIVACIITVGVLALLSDRLLHALYRRLTPWARGT